MESSTLRLCSNCEHRHISTVAVTWCPDCDEALCTECKDHHDASKIAKFHRTILLAEYDKLPSFIKDRSVYCSEHDQKCELYCCSHSQLCCTACLIESHIPCEKLETIHDVKTSPALEDIENGLKCLMINLDSLLQNRLENKTRINAQKSVIMEEFQSFRELVNGKLDDMGKSLQDKIETDVKELGFDLDNLSQDFNVHKSNIIIMQEELKVLLVSQLIFKSS
ncbi:E3 ubiquitin/ISG15 ligase TRIM25-like [Mytilus trossulus]|uniref:E3 ubiquitin/ISG15 ligase TRIM25-like n=1 Tax=Mytilus trossulus TaxID=6551 RepID=UPI0030076F2C